MRRLSPQFDTPLYGATRCENEFARKFAAKLKIIQRAPYLRDKKQRRICATKKRMQRFSAANGLSEVSPYLRAIWKLITFPRTRKNHKAGVQCWCGGESRVESRSED